MKSPPALPDIHSASYHSGLLPNSHQSVQMESMLPPISVEAKLSTFLCCTCFMQRQEIPLNHQSTRAYMPGEYHKQTSSFPGKAVEGFIPVVALVNSSLSEQGVKSQTLL